MMKKSDNLYNDIDLSKANSDFLSLFKCINNLFSLEIINMNIPLYILSAVILLNLASIFVFIFYGYPRLFANVAKMVNNRLKITVKKNDSGNLLNKGKNANNSKNTKKPQNSKNPKNPQNANNNKKKNGKKNQNKNVKKDKKINNFPPKKKGIKFSNIEDLDASDNKNSNCLLNRGNNNNLSLRLKNNNNKNNNINNNKKVGTKKNVGAKKNNKRARNNLPKSLNLNKILSSKKKTNNNNINKIKFNDYEMNTLIYSKAVLYDKRTCCQYYISLLKTKHPILFAFCPINDYNSQIIKICIFFFSFAINYGFNFIIEFNNFFINIVHKVYEDEGKYDILFYLPYIAIAFGASYIITIIMRISFLSERNIAPIRQKKLPYEVSMAANEAKGKIKIKVVIFFIVGIIILGGFWFMMSIFGSIYKNIQIILLENSLIGFGMSLIFPFFINLFPCIFRLSAIHSKGNSECMYKFSLFLQVL